MMSLVVLAASTLMAVSPDVFLLSQYFILLTLIMLTLEGHLLLT